MPYYTIQGDVRDQHGNAMTGVTVTVSNIPGAYRVFSYDDDVNASGHYYFCFSSSTASWIYTEQNGYYLDEVAWSFVVKDAAGNELAQTERAITWSQFCYGTTVNLTVTVEEDKDEVCSGCVPCEYRVSGWVRQPDGSPVAGAQVTVYRQNFRTREGLRSAVTDAYGNYTMTYATDEDCKLEGPGIELSVEAKQGSTVLAGSGVICDPPRLLTMNLVVGDAADESSEYDRVAAAVHPHMDGQAFTTLLEGDVAFLVCRSAFAEDVVRPFVNAWVLSGQRPLHVAPEPSELGPKAYYAWLRAGEAIDLAELRSRSIDALVDGLLVAETNGWVPARADTDLPSRTTIATRLKGGVSADDWLVPGSFLHQVLTYDGLLSATQANAFVNDYETHTGTLPEFWVAQQVTLTAALANHARFRLGIGPVMQWHLPLMAEVETELSAASQERAPQDLAAYRYDQLRDLLDVVRSDQTVVGVPDAFPDDAPDESHRRDHFARVIVRAIEHAYYHRALAHRLQELGSTLMFPIPSGTISAGAVGAFLMQWPDFPTLTDPGPFDIRTTSIPEYFRAHDPAQAHVDEADGLKLVARLLAVATPYEQVHAIRVLVDDGYRSASQIAAGGLSEFLADMGDKLDDPLVVARTGSPGRSGREAAREVFQRANEIYTALGQLVTMASSSLNPAIRTVNNPNAARPFATSASVTFPPDDTELSLQSLFGGFDSCTCQHCRSVLSPAAYLVDLLRNIGSDGRRWLRQHEATQFEIGQQLV